ncbi:MAG: ABC transporter permease [Gemmatimonadaceae bacterium]
MTRTARILRNGLRGMSRNRLRTFFMMLGTFVGVSALTVLVAIGRGTQREVLERMERMFSGSTILLRSGGSRVIGGAHGPPTTTLTLDDIRAIDSTLDYVERSDPYMMIGQREVMYEGRNGPVRIAGHSEAAEVVWNRSVTRGAYFTSADVASAARVALVGETVVRDLFGGRDPVGAEIRIGAIPFRVLGVLDRIGIDPHGLDKDNEIVIPISTMMRRVLNVDYVMGAKLALRSGSDLDAAAIEIGDIMRRRHALGPDVPDDFTVHTPVQARQGMESANRVFTVFLPLIAVASILVGGLVVANLMLMTVNERRAEIGLRKAMGARPRDIRLQFLAESAAVTGLGGVLAVAVGYAIVQALAAHRGTPSGMPWMAALLGLGAAVAVGLVSGVVPARRAAGLDPVTTLR